MHILSLAWKNALKFFTLAVRPVHINRLAAALMIALVGTPTIFTSPASNARAASEESSAAAVPFSKPAEPFVIHSPAPFSRLATMLGDVSAQLGSLTGQSRPEGLGAARVPTLTERVYALSLLPISALVKVTGRTASTGSVAPAPPPQPASVVDFDFDNDGKADVGRWHSANAELKVKNSNGGSYSTFTVGSSAARLAPGDFNGDGKTDAA